MGMSTPKPPFDLAAFLAEKATPGARRKPAWNRPRTPAPERDTETETRTEEE